MKLYSFLIPFIILFGYSISTPILACDQIYFGYTSHHFKDSYNYDDAPNVYTRYNERNYGFGCDNAVAGLDIVAYENSYRKTALSVSETAWLYSSNYVDLGLQIGGIYGYKNVSGLLVTPYILPKLDIKMTKKLTGEIVYGVDVLAFTIKYRVE